MNHNLQLIIISIVINVRLQPIDKTNDHFQKVLYKFKAIFKLVKNVN